MNVPASDGTYQRIKLAGHLNEDSIIDLVKKESSCQTRLLNCSRKNDFFESTQAWHIEQIVVPSVLEDFVQSKTDIKFLLVSGQYINVSICPKKANGAGVYSPSRFIQAWEKQMKRAIPDDICRDLIDFANRKLSTNKYQELVLWISENISLILSFVLLKAYL